MKAVTIERLFAVLGEQIKMGNAKKKILLADDDEGNGFHTMYYEISKTEGNVEYSNLHGISEEDAINNYVILG